MPDVFNKQLTIITKLKSNSKTNVATIEQLILKMQRMPIRSD